MMNRVLIIEDDEEQCISLERSFRRRGLMPTYVHTRKEGIELARKEDFACIVHDLGLPDSDRMESAQLLPEFGDIPIVALTGDDDPELMRICHRHKVGYCLKPVDTAEIVGKVLMLIERRYPSREVEEAIIETHRERTSSVVPPIPPLTNDTKVSLSLAQMFWLIGSIVMGTAAVVVKTSGVERSLEALKTQHEYFAKDVDKRLTGIEGSVREGIEGDKSRDKATSERLSDWTPWRWSVTQDLHRLGETTHTPVTTPPNR